MHEWNELKIHSLIHSLIHSFISFIQMHFISFQFNSFHSFIHSFISFHVMSFRLNSFQSFYSFIYSFLPFFLSYVHSFHFISFRFPLISFQLTSFQITNNSCKQTCSYSLCPIFEASARAVCRVLPGIYIYIILLILT